MKNRVKISFICFLLVGCGFFLMGLFYIFSPTVMPYHLDAMEIEWNLLPKGQRLVSLAILKGSGSGMMVAGFSILLLLLIPFRKGESWAIWGIMIIISLETIPTCYSILQLKKYTPGNPPLFLIVLIFLFAIIGFISISTYLKKKD